MSIERVGDMGMREVEDGWGKEGLGAPQAGASPPSLLTTSLSPSSGQTLSSCLLHNTSDRVAEIFQHIGLLEYTQACAILRISA